MLQAHGSSVVMERVETLQGQVDSAIGSPVKRAEAATQLPVSGAARVPSGREGLPLTFEVPAGGSKEANFPLKSRG